MAHIQQHSRRQPVTKSKQNIDAKHRATKMRNRKAMIHSLVTFCTGVGVEIRNVFGFGSGVRMTSSVPLFPNATGSAQVGTAGTGGCGQ
jgi:hypothetical protein